MDHSVDPLYVIIPYGIKIHDDTPVLYEPAPDDQMITIDPQLTALEGLEAIFCFEIMDDAISFDDPPITWRDAPLSEGKTVAQPRGIQHDVEDGTLTITVTPPSPLLETITHHFDINVLYQKNPAPLTIWTPGGLRRVDPTIVEKPAEGPPGDRSEEDTGQ